MCFIDKDQSDGVKLCSLDKEPDGIKLCSIDKKSEDALGNVVRLLCFIEKRTDDSLGDKLRILEKETKDVFVAGIRSLVLNICCLNKDSDCELGTGNRVLDCLDKCTEDELGACIAVLGLLTKETDGETIDTDEVS